MKQSTLVLALFLCLSTAAQQTANVPGKEIPKYSSVQFEELKKFKSADKANSTNNNSRLYAFSYTQSEIQEYNFKPLQQYLSQDIQQYSIQTNKESWTQFTSGMLSSFQKQQWLENKNNVQQRWMLQTAKKKQ